MKSREQYQKEWYLKNKEMKRLQYLERTGAITPSEKNRLNRLCEKMKTDAVRRLGKNDSRDMAIVKDFRRGISQDRIQSKYGLSETWVRKILAKRMGDQYESYKPYGKNGTIRREYIGKLETIAKRLRRIPMYYEAEKFGIPRSAIFELRPKLVEMGYKTVRDSTKEDIIRQCVSLTRRLGKIPSAYYLQRVAGIDYENYFGTIGNVRKEVEKQLNKKAK